MFFIPKHWEPGIAVLEDDVLRKAKTQHNFSEKRSEPRLLLSIPARYRSLKKKFGWKPACTLDVSQNGVRLATRNKVALHERIGLEIKLPEFEKPFQLNGVVVWVKPSLNNDSFTTCGVAFENLKRVNHKEKFIGFMADKLCHLAIKHTPQLICHPAQSLEDLKKSYKLVYKEYLS